MNLLIALLLLSTMLFGQVSSIPSATGTGGGATSSLELTDSKITKTSSTVLTVAPGVWGHGTASMTAHAGTTINIATLAISNATNATPIEITTPSLTNYSLRTGDTIMITGVVGNTAANGTWVVEKLSDTTIALNGSVGNGAYTSGGTIAGSGNGTAVIYGSPQGYVVIDAPASSGLLLTCPTACVMNQSVTPAVASDGTPLGSITITTGAWGTLTDTRRYLNAGTDIQAGTGISVSTAAGTATVSTDSTVVRTSITNTFTGSNSFTAATRTAPHRSGSGAPAASCTVGDTYFRTDATAGQNMYLCTSTNTWTQDTGGGGGLAMYDLPFLDYNATSGSFDPAWNFSDSFTATGYDASGASCPATSGIAECGFRWFGLGDATQRWGTRTIRLPSTWTSGTITFSLLFATGGTIDPVFKVATKCYTSGSVPPAYNASQTLPSGTVATGRTYTRSVNLDTTGCAGGRAMTIQLTRDDNTTSAIAIVFHAAVQVTIP